MRFAQRSRRRLKRPARYEVVRRADPAALQRMKFIVAHSGKQHAYRHALAMQNRGRLAWFLTSTYYRPDRRPEAWLRCWPRADRAMRRRHLDGLDEAVRRQLWLELPEVACRALIGNGRLAQHLTYVRDAAFDRWVARGQLRAGDAQGFWGFQGGAGTRPAGRGGVRHRARHRRRTHFGG